MKIVFDYNKMDMDKLIKQLTSAQNDAEIEVMKVLEKEANNIKTESLNQVPVDTGSLKDSFFIKNLNKFTVYLGYGGFGTNFINPKNKLNVKNYMMKVHEDLTTPHKVGKAKFFEQPLRAASHRLKDILAITLYKVFKKNGGA